MAIEKNILSDKIGEIVTNCLLINKGFKIHDGHQLGQTKIKKQIFIIFKMGNMAKSHIYECS